MIKSVIVDLLMLQDVIRAPSETEASIILRQLAPSGDRREQMRAILREMSTRGVKSVLVHLGLSDTERFLRSVKTNGESDFIRYHLTLQQSFMNYLKGVLTF